MDRLIAVNSVPLADADTAPATGTPQYATSGNPATSTPATVWPAYAFNAIQDEIYNVIVAAGITPNGNTWNQLLAAIRALAGPGSYLGRQVITTSGTYTPGTYNGVTATKANFHGQAAGGAGGGGVIVAAGQGSAGAGGNAGNPFDFWVIAGLAAMSITLGAPGTGVLASAGNAGGNIVIGSIATIMGGKGGGPGGVVGTFPAFNSLNNTNNAASTIASAGGMIVSGVVSGIGQLGGIATLLNSGQIQAGNGGYSMWGSVPSGASAGSVVGYGVGAPGTISAAGSGSGSVGGTGGLPLLIIDEYA